MSDLTPLPPEAAIVSHSRLPADYYGASPYEVRPIFPRWVPVGCGIAAAALLLVAFAVGAIVAHTGVGNLMDLLLGSMQNEIQPMYAREMSPAQRASLDSEFGRLRANVRDEKLSIARLDPVISAVREASADHTISAAEAVKMTGAMKALNDAAATRARPVAAQPARH